MQTLDTTGWKTFASSAIAVLFLVLGAEIAVRVVFPDDDWRYWRFPVGERLDLLAERPTPDVLFVGDSAAAFNYVPETFDAASGFTSFNLGTRANAPLAFKESMVHGVLAEMDPLPDWIVVSFSSRTFWNDPNVEGWEKSVLGSPYVRELRGKPTWSDRIGLGRLRLLVFRGMKGINAPDDRLSDNAGWTPFGTGPQGRDRARTRVPKYPLPNLPSRKKKKKPKRTIQPNPERLRVVTELADLQPAGGVVLIVMPSPQTYADPLVKSLRKLRHPKLDVWDYSKGSAFKGGDGVHMYPEVARRFSTTIGKRFKKEYGTR